VGGTASHPLALLFCGSVTASGENLDKDPRGRKGPTHPTPHVPQKTARPRGAPGWPRPQAAGTAAARCQNGAMETRSAHEPTPPLAIGEPPAHEAFGEPAPRQPLDAGRRSLLRRLWGPLAVAVVLAIKFGAKLKALLLLIPKLKILTTSGTMLVSIAAYSLIWGWKFAVGFVLLLLVHEMGHVIQLRREGVPASAPMFIPFLGAVISAKSLGGNALAEARVGLAGPVLGTAGAAVLLPVAEATGNDLWRALAFTGFFLNLFNLVPVVPLDGGRAMAALAPWMWFVGFAAMVVAAFVFPNPIILLILLFGGMETWRRWRLRREGGAAEEAYYRVAPRDRLAVAGVYVGLIVLLAYGMHASHIERSLSDV
jgi:Zn-dependent protease